MWKSLGIVRSNVGPVRVTSNLPTLEQDFMPCYSITIQALSTNTGRIHIGLAGMDTVTGANVLYTLAIPSTNVIPSWTDAILNVPGGHNAADLFIAPSAVGVGEGVRVFITK